MKRETGIDIARGAGILFIVCLHAHVADAWFNSFAVAYFFVLSGYFFSEKSTIREFIKKKAVRLLLPYLFFLMAGKLFYLLLLLVSGRAAQVSLPSLLNVANADDNPPVWFLLALFEVGVLYKCLTTVIRQQVWLLLAVVAISAGGLWFAKAAWKLPLFMDTACSMLLFYYTGHQVKRRAWLQRAGRYGWIITTILLVLFCAGQYFRQGTDIRTNTILGSPLPYLANNFTGSFCCMLFFYYCPLPSMLAKGLRYLGVNSLLICCVHYPLLEMARPLASLVAARGSIAYAFVVLITCLGLSILLIEMCRKPVSAFYARFKLYQ
ncbi:Fucose 4-O-acetylase [Chitinophaga costaii]|uniref:Fucose 4-O-acetylase n=1 Tax=Chitinophaga costaii TaxID=1335309 RepID=A0A1C3ZAY2_9BACT|nr:acyltransferase family protein [Chitinophaga costaii]PUZ30297.1 hypothetical protein DCM91_02140 [Chitinophaga costaii]SCB79448.1 Fucose 4-O-acetylase [Chitinophaga costaii]